MKILSDFLFCYWSILLSVYHTLEAEKNQPLKTFPTRTWLSEGVFRFKSCLL
jgi:hypothetical protein